MTRRFTAMIVKMHHSNDVITVAALLFREKGYYGTSMNDIAEKSGIPEQAIHERFTSKEELAIAVMTKIQEYFDKDVLIHAYDGNLLPKDRVIKINDLLSDYFSVDKSGCVFVNFAIETMGSIPIFVASIRRYFDSLTEAYKAIFSHCYDPDAAHALAKDFVCDLQGALVLMRVTGTNRPLRRISERTIQALCG